MYSIYKTIIVLKLALILLIITAGMGIVSEVQDTVDNVRSYGFDVLESSIQEQKKIESDSTIQYKTRFDRAEPDIRSCPMKGSLSDLRLFVEL